MIQTDKEIELKIENLQTDLFNINTKIKILNIFHKSIIIIAFIYLIFSIKGLSCYVDNVIIISILSMIFFFLTVCIADCVEKYLTDTITKLCDSQKSLKEQIEDTLNFSAYLLACRHIQAIEQGNNETYKELRYNDSIYVVNEYKDIYEDRRIEYEKQHQARIEFNKNRQKQS